MASTGDVFKAGETVPISGVYDVIHDQIDGQAHAHPCQVMAIQGTVFPPCRGCNACVSFRLFLAVEHIDANVHFGRKAATQSPEGAG